MKSNNENNKYNGSNEYEKAIDFLEKRCKCGCSSKIPKEEFAELRESFQALSISEQDIFFEITIHPLSKTYLNMAELILKILERNHLINNGLLPRIHGNIKNASMEN